MDSIILFFSEYILPSRYTWLKHLTFLCISMQSFAKRVFAQLTFLPYLGMFPFFLKALHILRQYTQIAKLHFIRSVCIIWWMPSMVHLPHFSTEIVLHCKVKITLENLVTCLTSSQFPNYNLEQSFFSILFDL